MKTFALVAAAVATVAIGSVLLTDPASAGYVSPDWPWQIQAFCLRGCSFNIP